jgi:hypothetical protein
MIKKMSPLAACFALLLSAAPAWTAPGPAGSLAIQGRIAPRAAEGVRVELHPYLQEDFAEGTAGPLAETRPAADGSFTLRAPEPGFYQVVVRTGTGRALGYPLLPLVEATELPLLDPFRQIAEWVEDPKPGRRLEPAGPGHDQNVQDQTGRVIDAVTRQPVAGAFVWQTADGGRLSWGRTAADGSFRIAAVAAPLGAAAPGYARAFRPEASLSAPVSLSLRPAVALTGQVVDTEGRPVAGAEVRAVPTDPFPYRRGLRDLRVAWTGADGTFRLRGVPVRSMVRVKAQAESFAPTTKSAGTGEPGQAPAPVRLVLGPGATVTGRLLNPDGKAVAGAQVLLSSRAATDAGLETGSEEIVAVSGADGRFRFERLDSGTRDLLATASGFSVDRQIEIPDGPGAAGTLDVGDLRMSDQTKIEDRVARYFPEARVDPGAGTTLSPWVDAVETGRSNTAGPRFAVAGRVTDEGDRPVAGARILLSRQDRQSPIVQATTGADGRFEAAEVPAGSYRLLARAEGFVDTVAPEGVRVDAGPVSGLAVRMARGGVISGRILGLAEHEYRSVHVTAWRDGANFPIPLPIPLRALVDNDGRFRINGVPPGEWRVTARRTSAYVADGTARVSAPGEEAKLDLRFPEGIAVAGRVLRGGQPLAGAMVSLGNAETIGRQARQTRTLGDGTFVISAVEPGSYRLLVLAGEVRHVRPLEIPVQGEVVIEVGEVGGEAGAR